MAREPRGAWVVTLLFVTFLCLQGKASACQSTDVCAAASPDGSRVVFTTEDPLVPEDGERYGTDVYELMDGRTTRLLTPTPAGGPDLISTLKGLSRDGSRVIVQTGHPYAPSDIETTPYPDDLYVLEAGTWSLVTPEPAGPLPILAGYTEDARHVYFETSTGLAPNDTDADFDLYEWSNGSAHIVSTGPTERTIPPSAENPPRQNFVYNGPGIFGAATEDGSRVYFTLNDNLTPGADSDRSRTYVRINGTTTEWIPPEAGGASRVVDVSPDGSRLYLQTGQQLDPFDTDNTTDIYVREASGAFTLISRGAAAGNGNGAECGVLGPGCGEAFYLGASQAGDRVFFQTFERLVGDDVDTSLDIYERSGTTTTLVTPGTENQAPPNGRVRAPMFEGISADGTQVAFTSWSQLVPQDKDLRPDIYVRSGGVTHLISTGPPRRENRFDPVFADFADNGDNVIFWTRQPLVPADSGEDGDIYQRVNFNAAPGKTATASARGKRKGGKGRRAKTRGRTVLVSASAARIRPRIRISSRGRSRSGRSQVRVSCSTRESSGSCSGTVKAAGAAKKSFRLKRARSGWVTVGKAGALKGSVAVVVRAKDAVGTRAKIRRRVRF